ncbi:MAG: hypothetical protein KME15_06070 [Drouetiella hepatica Uher 2000/2452]|jgi:hypothetical protein|uniref:Uncharacterized protein n=1 Tax=Drouetiella hepatica Uher 2000/2452 TaxID=904376 RepID=A0A951ULF3_9CYAN|nr:hypothetical protein [Drouetiella hepatica Uher 2000/2452]
MVSPLIDELYPAGMSLFLGSESFLKDLSEEDESTITGGKRSQSGRSNKRKKKRRVRKARRRVVRSRSNSNS